MLMLDLFSGLGGASAAAKAHGWDVVTVDLDPQFKPDVVADVRQWHWTGPTPDLLWASPPCTEFARESMPWCRTGATPDLSCVAAVVTHVAEVRPKFWIMENVRGAQRWIGRAPQHLGPYYFWGWYPEFTARFVAKKKESFGSKDDARRAFIPFEISEALVTAVERVR